MTNKKYFIVTLAGQIKDSSNIVRWTHVINYSPLSLLRNTIDAEEKVRNSPTQKSYYINFWIEFMAEISFKEWLHYSNSFEN